ncbi:MAG: glycosyltransferase family 87 protein [Chloroflexota bacterium]
MAQLPRLVVTAIVLGLGISYLWFAVSDWRLTDAEAYWNAAMRLRDGLPLYPPLSNVEASDVYRYAPWFAWLAVPLTFLPVAVAGALWSTVLVLASCFAILPLVHRGAWLAAAFFWPILIGISAIGNVQPLLVAALVLGVERRSGPLWIAAAASLKVVPILFTLVYLGRREWGRAAAAFAITIVLVAPAFLYDLSGYPSDAGRAAGLFQEPPLYVAVVLVLAATSLLAAKSRGAWLAAAATAVVALPRLFVYDVTFVLIGLPAEPDESQT